jgi:hypothetical protein
VFGAGRTSGTHLETQVRATGKEQNGRTVKSTFFPFEGVFSMDTPSRKEEEFFVTVEYCLLTR